MKRVRRQCVHPNTQTQRLLSPCSLRADIGDAVPISPFTRRLSFPTTLYSQKSRQQLWHSCLSLSAYLLRNLYSKRTQYLAQPGADVGQLSAPPSRTYSTVGINRGIEREPETTTWVHFRPTHFRSRREYTSQEKFLQLQNKCRKNAMPRISEGPAIPTN